MEGNEKKNRRFERKMIVKFFAESFSFFDFDININAEWMLTYVSVCSFVIGKYVN